MNRAGLARAVALATLLACPCPVAATGSVDDLAGLWKATRWFGPRARGPLVVYRSGTSFTAEMVGQTHALRSEKGELVFDLRNGEGAFRGKLESDGTILGHWFPPPSSAQFTGGVYASPVRLRPAGANRWAGDVRPFEDWFTFYLMARKRAAGTMGAILRNPERDYGTWLGVDHIEREGNVVRLVGKRIGQKEESVAATGSYDSVTNVITLAFPDRGGSYDFRRDGDQSHYYPRGRNPGRYVYRPPLARDDGWPTATLEEAGIDMPAIERFIQWIVDTPMDSARTAQVHGVLVARHGKLVLEEYFHGEHRDKLHETRSAAKSLTATIVGAAIQAGVPLKLSTPVYALMSPDSVPSDPRKRAMTLEHLLTTSSGYFCDDSNPEAPGNEEAMINQTVVPDYYGYTLAVPMAMEPGERAIYCSANPNLALGMVGRATGESPMYAFDRLLAAPMKIHHYGWILDPAGNPYGGGSVQFLPRDFMKLGQLMLNDGTWEGERILDRGFVERASAPLYHLANIYYGYLWWSIDYPYKDRSVRAFFAGGSGGQGVMVIPDLDLVVATYGANYSAGRTAIHIQQELTPRYILPAVREPRDDRTAAVEEREFRSPYGRSEIRGKVAKPVPSRR